MSEKDGLVEAIQRGSIEHRKAHHDGIWWHCREWWRDISDESCEGGFRAASVRAWLRERLKGNRRGPMVNIAWVEEALGLTLPLDDPESKTEAEK